jgi:hypothetical protein
MNILEKAKVYQTNAYDIYVDGEFQQRVYSDMDIEDIKFHHWGRVVKPAGRVSVYKVDTASNGGRLDTFVRIYDAWYKHKKFNFRFMTEEEIVNYLKESRCHFAYVEGVGEIELADLGE